MMFLGPAECQTVLNSTLSNERCACPGEQVVFTCITRGSHTLVWSSNEYIGSGGYQLEFSIFIPRQQQRSIYVPKTIAVLSSVNGASSVGNEELISQLHIIASLDSTVSCHDDTGKMVSIHFSVVHGKHR